MDIKQQFIAAANAYVKEFEKRFGVRLDFWVVDDVGGTAMFGDRYFNFDDIRLAVDANLDSDMLFDWYDANLEYHDKAGTINLYAWIKGLRHEKLLEK